MAPAAIPSISARIPAALAGRSSGRFARPRRRAAVESDHRAVAGEGRRLLVQRGREHLHDRRADERRAAGQSLVEDRRRGEEVGPRVHLAARHLLGGHVAGRADDQPRAGQLGRGPERRGELARERAGEAEVEELDAVRGEEDVRGLQVPVDDAGRVEGLEGGEDVARHREGLVRRQRAAREPGRERFAGEQLHRDEEAPGVLADLVDLADVRVVDRGRRPGLAAETPAGRLVGLGDRLHRDAPAEALVLGGEDDAHAALADALEQAVAAEGRHLADAPASRGRRAQPVHDAPQQPSAGGLRVRRRPAVRAVVLGHLGEKTAEYSRGGLARRFP
ncbi:MAG: hypothetical protein U0599_05430 [Vicinamibacteria bacterium]